MGTYVLVAAWLEGPVDSNRESETQCYAHGHAGWQERGHREVKVCCKTPTIKNTPQIHPKELSVRDSVADVLGAGGERIQARAVSGGRSQR